MTVIAILQFSPVPAYFWGGWEKSPICLIPWPDFFIISNSYKAENILRFSIIQGYKRLNRSKCP